MNIRMQKRGISLIVLVITIVVSLILVSVVVLNTDDSRESAKKTVFISDMTTVEDAVKEYYIINGELPVYDSAAVNNTFDLASLTSVNDDSVLLDEIAANSDNTATFYLIDLSLLDLKNLSMGLGYKTNGSKDVFVVSYPNLRLYYLKGKKFLGKYYFSLTEELTGRTIVEDISYDDSSTSISSQTSSGRLKFLTGNAITNKFSATLIAQININETLNMSISDGAFFQITKTDNTNNITVGENIVRLEEVLTETQINDIIEYGNITITINDGAQVIESLEVNINNISTNGPTFGDDDIINSYDEENTLTFSVSPQSTDIAYVKYDYDDIYDKDVTGGISKYYSSLDQASLDSYVNLKGKTAQVSSDNKCTISAPKNVKSVRIVAIDKAGNSTYVTKNISKGIYSVASLKSQNGTTININSNVISTIGIKNVVVTYSLDGVNYTGSTPYTLNLQNSAKATTEIQFKNITSSIVYMKIQATSYSGSVIETSVTKLVIPVQQEVVINGGEPQIDLSLYEVTANMIKADATSNGDGTSNKYIGQTVNYSGYSENTNNITWKIFGVDKLTNKILLITDDYVDLTYKTVPSEITKSGYSIYFSNRDTFIQYLKNSTNWVEYSLLGKTSAYGAPTVEQFLASYELRYPSKYLIGQEYLTQTQATNAGKTAAGWEFKFSSGDTSFAIYKVIQDTNSFYAKPTASYGGTNIQAYWLASRSCYSTTTLIAVDYYPYICYNWVPNTAHAVRPIVSLDSAKLYYINNAYIVK